MLAVVAVGSFLIYLYSERAWKANYRLGRICEIVTTNVETNPDFYGKPAPKILPIAEDWHRDIRYYACDKRSAQF